MTGRRSQPWPQPARASRSQPAAGTRKGTQTPPVRRARPQGCALRFTRRGTNQAPRQLEAPNAARPPPAQRRSLRPRTTQPPLLSPPPRGAQARAEGGTAQPPQTLPFFLSSSPRLQKVYNPTGAACAAAPRSLQTLARAGSRRAASGRSLQTLGQNFSSWRERVPVAPHFLQPGRQSA